MTGCEKNRSICCKILVVIVAAATAAVLTATDVCTSTAFLRATAEVAVEVVELLTNTMKKKNIIPLEQSYLLTNTMKKKT